MVARSSGADNGMALGADAAHDVLDGLQRNRGLTHVSLNANQMRVDDVCALLRANSTLRHLGLRGIACTTLYGPYCREALLCGWLQWRDSGARRNRGGIPELADALSANSTLTSLDVRENKLERGEQELLERCVRRVECSAADADGGIPASHDDAVYGPERGAAGGGAAGGGAAGGAPEFDRSGEIEDSSDSEDGGAPKQPHSGGTPPDSPNFGPNFGPSSSALNGLAAGPHPALSPRILAPQHAPPALLAHRVPLQRRRVTTAPMPSPPRSPRPRCSDPPFPAPLALSSSALVGSRAQHYGLDIHANYAPLATALLSIFLASTC